MEDRIKQVMADVLGIEKEMINCETSVETVNVWDSLKQMNLLVAIEEEFDIEFEDSEMSEMTSYSKIKEAVSKKC